MHTSERFGGSADTADCKLRMPAAAFIYCKRDDDLCAVLLMIISKRKVFNGRDVQLVSLSTPYRVYGVPIYESIGSGADRWAYLFAYAPSFCMRVCVNNRFLDLIIDDLYG